MKNPKFKKQHAGFTLVELLVVIAIIAVLAGVGFAGARAAMQKAKQTTATAVATNVAIAIEQFYSEYSTLPELGGAATSGDLTLSDAQGVTLLNILAGLETGTSIQNQRKLKFLEIKEAKNGMDGVIYNAAGNEIADLVDPWGIRYNIILDTDYSDTIALPSTVPSSSGTVRGKKAIVYSFGTATPADAKPKTFVKTW